MSRRVHVLRCDQPYFDDILLHKKSFELRLFDREFRVGDWLMLLSQRLNANPDRMLVPIKYILSGEEAEKYGLKTGHCILGLDTHNMSFKILVKKIDEEKIGVLVDIRHYHSLKLDNSPSKISVRWSAGTAPNICDKEDLELIGVNCTTMYDDIIIVPEIKQK